MAKKKERLGNMNEKVDFIRVYENEGSYSDNVTEVPLRPNRWCRINYIGSPSAGASEEYINEQPTGKIKIEIITRFFPGLTFRDYVLYYGAKFDIYSIQLIGRREGYRLRAEMRDDNTDILPTGGLPTSVDPNA